MFREAHRRYTRTINRREGWTGHLWQDRYASSVMDESHALMAARYIENNPVQAGMVGHAEQYRWSSAAYHTGIRGNDPLIAGLHPLRQRVADWPQYLDDESVEKNSRQLVETFLGETNFQSGTE